MQTPPVKPTTSLEVNHHSPALAGMGPNCARDGLQGIRIDGEVVVVAGAGPVHQVVLGRVTRVLQPSS